MDTFIYSNWFSVLPLEFKAIYVFGAILVTTLIICLIYKLGISSAPINFMIIIMSFQYFLLKTLDKLELKYDITALSSFDMKTKGFDPNEVIFIQKGDVLAKIGEVFFIPLLLISGIMIIWLGQRYIMNKRSVIN